MSKHMPVVHNQAQRWDVHNMPFVIWPPVKLQLMFSPTLKYFDTGGTLAPASLVFMLQAGKSGQIHLDLVGLWCYRPLQRSRSTQPPGLVCMVFIYHLDSLSVALSLGVIIFCRLQLRDSLHVWKGLISVCIRPSSHRVLLHWLLSSWEVTPASIINLQTKMYSSFTTSPDWAEKIQLLCTGSTLGQILRCPIKTELQGTIICFLGGYFW